MGEVHNLKTWTPFFEEVRSGSRTFEVRKNDRNFKVGDTLILEDFDPDTEKYKPAWVPVEVTYILSDPRFVKEDFVVMGIKIIEVNKR